MQFFYLSGTTFLIPETPFSYEVMILSLANAVERSKILEISMTSPAYPVYASLGRENNWCHNEQWKLFHFAFCTKEVFWALPAKAGRRHLHASLSPNTNMMKFISSWGWVINSQLLLLFTRQEDQILLLVKEETKKNISIYIQVESVAPNNARLSEKE